jgi:Mechanosensitive ion channel/Conserved TM helix
MLTTDLLTNMMTAAFKFSGAIAVLIIGYIISRVVTRLISALLAKAGVDTLAAKVNDIDMMQQYNMQLRPSVIISKFIYYILLLLFMTVATDVLGMAVISTLVHDIINYIPNVIVALIIMVFGLFIADLAKGVVVAAGRSFNIPSNKILGDVIFYFIFLTAMVSALGQAKVDTDFIKNNLSIILGGAVGAFSLAYGLASRDVMANLLGAMYSRKRFRVGDVVRIEGAVGRIAAMDSTSVVLNAPDKQIIIPLSKFMKESVEVLPNDFLQLDEH